MPIEMTEGPGTLPMLRVSTPGSSGEIFLQGAHVASWTPRGHRPVLWMSGTSRFARGEPIRGGIPICFPWFSNLESDPAAPTHGFARLQEWELLEATETADTATVVLRLADSEESRGSAWPHRFEALYRVTMGAELTATLDVTNRDHEIISFEEALHSYYAVADVHMARVIGLERAPYLEKGRMAIERDEAPLPGKPGISRRYTGVTTATIEDPGNEREIVIRTAGARGAVVWNPGQAVAATMDDFDDDGWRNTLCIESCNLAPGEVRLAPGERHALQVSIAVQPPIPQPTSL